MEKPKKLSLKTEIENEAKQIEKELAEHPELDDVEVTDEMDRALWAKIRAYEQEKAEEEENRNLEIAEELVPEIPEAKPKKRYSRKRTMRVWVALAAVLVLVMGLGVTSMGSKSYWKVLLERLTGKAPVQMTNVEDMDSVGTEERSELDAYKEIEDALKISMVRVRYKPQKMYFKRYIVEEDMQQAQLFYECNGEILRYRVYLNNKDSSWGETTEDEKIDDDILIIKNIEIQMEEYLVPNGGLNRQVAEFEYEGVHYSLKGIIEKKEFQEIIKNLKFY